MSIFNALFGADDDTNTANTNIRWILLTNLMQLEEIVTNSEEKPIVLFKHSTRCSVSRMVLKQFEKEFDFKEKTDTYFLDLLSHRAISDAITERFEIRHESPQLLLVKNGKVVYNVSHSAISADDLRDQVD